MPCFFQDRCFAPDGGAPADWTVTPWLGGMGSAKRPQLVAQRTPIQAAFLLLPVGTTYHGTPETVFDWQGADVLPPILTQAARIGNGSRLFERRAEDPTL
jgi:hypothetical protein